MPSSSRSPCSRITAFLAAWGVFAPLALAGQVAVDSAVQLRERYVALADELEHSTIQKGLLVQSVESPRAPRGDAYAVVDYPFATVAGAFTSPANLCETLILHLNVQYCRAMVSGRRQVLSRAVGRKVNQPLEDTYRIAFAFKVAASDADFMRVELAAGKGALGTANYLIVVELIALERNTMRYYLAYDAYLHTLANPAPQRFEDGAARWFDETERFARQLREVKRGQYPRQQTVQ